jgi:hypothetical protein
MRLLLICSSVLLLAGCGMADLAGRPDGLMTAFEAYRTADLAGLRGARDAAQADAAAQLAKPGGDDPCTEQGVRTLKAEVVAYVAALLDNSTVLSMSPEARFVYAKQLAGGRLPRNAPAPPATRRCGSDQSELDEVREVVTLLSVARPLQREMEAWEGDLRRQYGAEYGARMAAATVTLRRNHVMDTGADPFKGRPPRWR